MVLKSFQMSSRMTRGGARPVMLRMMRMMRMRRRIVTMIRGGAALNDEDCDTNDDDCHY